MLSRSCSNFQRLSLSCSFRTHATTTSGGEGLLDTGKAKIFQVMSIYEEAIGLKEIKEAQHNVLEAERNFVDVQKLRRSLNVELLAIQTRLRDLRDEMDRLNRTDSRFLKLFTEEHEILKREKVLIGDYKSREDEERNSFFVLSAALRDSQEKERARLERTKFLQLGLSIACTSLGILSALMLNYFRSSNIKQILIYEKEQFGDVKRLVGDLATSQIELQALVSAALASTKAPIPGEAVVAVENPVVAEDKPVVAAPDLLLLGETRYLLLATSVLLGGVYFFTRNQ